MIFVRQLLMVVALIGALGSASVRADVLIDDFENVSDWAGLSLETTLVHNGAGAGRWGNQTVQNYINKVFPAPIDVSSTHFVQFWLYSGVANGALIELVFGSENSATTGGDYYRYTIQVDWTGWRYFSVPLDKFIVARTPIGWNKIDSVSLNAYGWGHNPLPDTLLILDDMSFAAGVVKTVNKTAAFVGADYVYTFAVDLEDRLGIDQTLTLGLLPETGYPFLTEILTPTIYLPAGGTAQAQVRVTVPASQITQATKLDLHNTTLLFFSGTLLADATNLSARVPLPHREHPRTLLDASDFPRMNLWATNDAWAASARSSIIASADGWPAAYNNKYNLATWSLPPEGGQWPQWYVCPIHGVSLTYDKVNQRHVDAVNGDVYTGSPYDQVIYGWRHSDLANYARDLGLAYRLTGNALYAQSAADILLAYADRYTTYPLHDINGGTSANSGRVMAQVLDESVWLIPIAWAYDLIADAPVLNGTQRQHIEQDLLRAARAVINWSGAPNQQSWNNAAIGAVGFALEDQDYISDAIRGAAGFESQMRNYINADGFWEEGSWGYHFYALDPITMLAEAATRGGYDLYTNNAPLRLMFEAPVAFAMPNWVLPSFGDGGSGFGLASNTRYFEPANYRYGPDVYNLLLASSTRSRYGLFWGAETVPTVTTQSLGSTLFDASGYAVLRASQGTDTSYVAIRYGISGGHDHPDKLSFVSYARGGVMGVDPGTVAYGAPINDGWYKQTIAHNTVVVDGVSQGKTTGSTGTLQRFVKMPALSMVAADGGLLYANMNLQRTQVLGNDYLLDRFRVRAVDSVSHSVDWIYHNFGTLSTPLVTGPYAGLPTTNGYQYMTGVAAAATDTDWQASFTAATPARALHLRMLGETGTTIVTGNGPGPNATQTVPFAMARRTSADTTFVSLLETASGASNVTVFNQLSTDAADADEALAVEIVATGYRDRVLALAAGGGGVRHIFGDAACDGTLCLIRTDSMGNITRLMFADGSRMEQACTQSGCVSVLQSSQILPALQIDIDRANNQVSVQSDTAITNDLWIYFSEGNSATRLTINGVSVNGIQLGSYMTFNVPVADLSFTSFTATPSPALTERPLTYTLTVNNAGPAAASNVIATHTLPNGVTGSGVASQGSCTGTSTIQCSLGTLNNAQSATITVTATPNAEALFDPTSSTTFSVNVNASATVTATEYDLNTTNNSASLTTPVKLACLGKIVTKRGTSGNNGSSNNRFAGTSGADVIHTLSGNDYVDGKGGNDTICGGAGNDNINGSGGADVLSGGSGTDTCNGGSGTDSADGSCETWTQ